MSWLSRLFITNERHKSTEIPYNEEQIKVEHYNPPKVDSVENKDDQLKENQLSSYHEKDAEYINAQHILNSFLERDFQEMGKRDAYVNPDMKFQELGIEKLCSEMITVGKKAKALTLSQIEKIKAAIETNKRIAHLDTVSRLEAKKKTYEDFLERIKDFQKGINGRTDECQQILISYEKGFLEGIADLMRANFF